MGFAMTETAPAQAVAAEDKKAADEKQESFFVFLLKTVLIVLVFRTFIFSPLVMGAARFGSVLCGRLGASPVPRPTTRSRQLTFFSAESHLVLAR